MHLQGFEQTLANRTCVRAMTGGLAMCSLGGLQQSFKALHLKRTYVYLCVCVVVMGVCIVCVCVCVLKSISLYEKVCVCARVCMCA